ncbi:MAG: phosphate/phosphite/phosphonate ABC transporter substrate-binding protein [Chloroflexota bacterium]|nr:phosphate/phosphite/phosphonate ABC transporter substrate-binding protein [Chloroflexota bacterium]
MSAAPSVATSIGPRLGSADRPIVMAFMPSAETARITASGKAIAASLEKATGLQWDVRVPDSYGDVVDGLCSGRIDVAWLDALDHVLAQQENCAELLLATERYDQDHKLSATTTSQIFVRGDSGLRTIADLKGKRSAFGDPLSLSATLFPMLKVKQETGQDPRSFFSSTVFTSGPADTVLAVYQGSVDAGASFVDARTLVEKRFPDIMQRTTVIATAGPIPNDTVSIRRSFPADLRGRIQKALLDYATSDAGTTALKSLYGIDGLAKADPKSYDSVLEAVKAAGLRISDLQKDAAATATPAPTPSASAAP